VFVFVNPDVKVASASKPVAPEPPKPEAPKPVFNPQEQAALDALSKNDNDEAIRLYTAIFDSNMQTPMLYFDHTSRGIAYLRKGQQDQALADFDAAVKLKPEDGDSHFRRGAIKFERMQYEDAIADLTVAINANPMNADAYNMRSFAYFRLMKNAEGGADGEKACELKKDYCNN
jgi:tetratricopeptide (TPR) repeat protein